MATDQLVKLMRDAAVYGSAADSAPGHKGQTCASRSWTTTDCCMEKTRHFAACIHSLPKDDSSGDAVRDSLVDPNATEVSAGIPDSCMGQVRDGLDSFVCSRL